MPVAGIRACAPIVQAIGAGVLALTLGTTWAAEERAPVTRIGADGPRGTKTAAPSKVDAQALIELVNQVERLQREVDRLRGDVEQQRYDFGEMRTRHRDGIADIDRRLQILERGGTTAGTMSPDAAPLPALAPANDPTLSGAPPGTAAAPGFTIEPGAGARSHPASLGGTGGEPPIPTAPTPAQSVAINQGLPPLNTGIDSPEAAQNYRAAFNLLKAGKYDDAIAAFNNYLVEYPNGASVDNAQYWLGEAYYVTREFEAAIGEYEKLLNAYPQSQKAAHAELKIGYSLQELGQADRARAQLERVVAQYPGTSAARLAGERLQQAGGAPAAP